MRRQHFPWLRRSKTTGMVGRFTQSTCGVAAVEFALIVPLLLTLLLAGLQVVVYVNASRKIGQIARSISQMISQTLPLNNSSTALVTAADIHFSYDSALLLFPYIMSDAKRQGIAWWQDVTISYAGISFSRTTSTCNDPTDQSNCYKANVVWTSNGLGNTAFRPCGVPQLPTSNTAPPDRATLPRSVFGPASLIVIDVVFDFTPGFASKFIRPIKISRTAYVQPRYASLIDYDMSTTDGVASKCPGY